MTPPPVRVVCVGLGWVSTHRHIPSIRRCPGLCLRGVIDRHEGRAALWAERAGLPLHAQAQRLEDVPWLNEIDALVIGAPPDAHAPLALAGLAAGKHVLTEKPFALSVEQGQAMCAAAQDAGKALCVVHNFQFGRAMRALARDRAGGRLGPLRRVAATQLGNPRRRLPEWYESLPGGLFYDESPHFFYLLRALAGGELRLCAAHALPGQNGKRTPRLVHLLYAGPGEVPFSIDCDFESSLSEWIVRVSFEKATALIDIFRDIYHLLPNDESHGPLNVVRTSASAISQHMLAHIPNGLALAAGRLDYGNDDVMKRFAHACRAQAPEDAIGPGAALDVLTLQHDALRALGLESAPARDDVFAKDFC